MRGLDEIECRVLDDSRLPVPPPDVALRDYDSREVEAIVRMVKRGLVSLVHDNGRYFANITPTGRLALEIARSIRALEGST